MEEVIRFEQVSKRYSRSPVSKSLRGTIDDVMEHWRRSPPSDSAPEELWALRDISFGVASRTKLGVIGHNGAGKTTILKLLSRITRPTEGRILLAGRVASLIELAAGFHPELTGKENVYLNGQILGMSRRQIRDRYDEIVAFSELKSFMDMPIKRYSSGMYARLGFSVAAHLNPDILLVDEVLAVGDLAFQQKCLRRMDELSDQGRAVVFVSHNMDAIQSLCTECLWIDHGQLRLAGESSKVVRAFLADVESRQALNAANGESLRHSVPDVTLDRIAIKDHKGVERAQFATGEDVVIELRLIARRRILSPHVAIGIGRGEKESIFMANMLLDGQGRQELGEESVLRCRFVSPPLVPGNYQVRVSVRDGQSAGELIRWSYVGGFAMTESAEDQNGQDSALSSLELRSHTSIYVPYEWEVD